MSAKSSIEWTDATWTPLRARVKENAAEIAEAKGYTSLVKIAAKTAGHAGPHCEHVSPGCDNCYSETNNGRCLPTNGTGLPFDRRSRDLVDLFVDERILAQPLHWKQPRRIFVCSQTDLFGEFYTDEMIDRVFAVMALCPQHTFQVLTKRAGRMREYMQSRQRSSRFWKAACPPGWTFDFTSPLDGKEYSLLPFPLPNVWLGVSVEDQQRADERIPELLRTPAAVRFLSAEPLLGPVHPARYLQPHWTPQAGADPPPWIDWVIVGGESGPDARPCAVAWIRSLVAQCKMARVPCFVKQLGRMPLDAFYEMGIRRLADGKGGAMAEWPKDLRVREMPAARSTAQPA